MNEQHLSWPDIEAAVGKVLDLMRADKFEPEYLVGIAVGGLIPLGLIAKKLDTRAVAIVAASSYEGKERGHLHITQLPDVDLKGKRVLLIDEIVESGETLRQVSEVLRTKYEVGALKTAVLAVNSEKCQFRLDYSALETTAWLVFPWEE